jgi:hypothetical protein
MSTTTATANAKLRPGDREGKREGTPAGFSFQRPTSRSAMASRMISVPIECFLRAHPSDNAWKHRLLMVRGTPPLDSAIRVSASR